MTANIILFYNLTPNSRNGIFDVPTTHITPPTAGGVDTWGQTYLEVLKQKNATKFPNAQNRYATLAARSYMVYDSYIDISLTNTDTYNSAQYAFVTYLAIVPTTGKILFYHVNNFQLLPSKIRIFTTPDYWATYIAYADISQVNISRTNLLINTQLLYLSNSNKPANNVTKNLIPIPYDFNNENKTVTISDLRIYAVISYVVYQNNKTELQANRTEVFVFDPKQLLGVGIAHLTTKFQVNMAYQMVSSIFAKNTTVSLDGLPAQVLNIYLYDKSLAGNVADETAIIGFETLENSTTPKIIFGMPLDQDKKTLTISMSNRYTPVIPMIDVGGSLGQAKAVGTEDNNIDLPQFVGYYYIQIEGIINADSIQIIVTTSNGSKDITQAYECPQINTSNPPLTYYEQLAKSLNIISNVVSGGAQVAAGTAAIIGGQPTGLTSIISGGLSLTNTFNNANSKPQNPTFVKGGNGFITYEKVFNGDPDAANQYIVVYGTQISANSNIDYDIKNNGAACDYTLNLTDDNLFSYLYYYTTNNLYIIDNFNPANMNAYIQCTCQVDNIPGAAADEIQSIFNEGARLNFVTVTV